MVMVSPQLVNRPMLMVTRLPTLDIQLVSRRMVRDSRQVSLVFQLSRRRMVRDSLKDRFVVQVSRPCLAPPFVPPATCPVRSLKAFPSLQPVI